MNIFQKETNLTGPSSLTLSILAPWPDVDFRSVNSYWMIEPSLVPTNKNCPDNSMVEIWKVWGRKIVSEIQVKRSADFQFGSYMQNGKTQI